MWSTAAHSLLPAMVAMEVAFVVTVRAMVVNDPAAITIPVAFIEERSIMVRLHPMCADVRRTRPVSFVPFIMLAHRVPVAAYPRIAFAGTGRLNDNDASPRRRPDSYSDRPL